MTAFITLNNMPVSVQSTARRTVRRQRVQFGDGYSQIITDGLNAQQEVWSLTTSALNEQQANGIESYLYRQKGQAFLWTPPNATKSFVGQFEGGILDLGYTNLDAVSLDGYSRPTDYTANLATGRLQSVTIANLTDVNVSLTLAPRSYVVEDGWEIAFISCADYRLTFTLRQVYV